MADLTVPAPGTPLNKKTILTATAASVLYLVLSAILIGFKTDQLFLVGLFNLLFYLSDRTRRFIIGFSAFIIFWIIFDFMKAFPNFRYNTVHIESIYHAEKSLFGIHMADGTVLTPNEYWRAHATTLLDVLAGICYLCWIPLPLAFAGYLFYKDKVSFFKFAITFLTVNLIGFVIYYGYPAAPPWYVQQYGFIFNAHTPGNVAGLGRFDEFFHVKIFAGLYAKSSNVFAAMPSLHASYPLTVFYYGIVTRRRWWNLLFGAIMVGIWFAAVYSSHHYVLDVLAGICCGITGISLFNLAYNKKGAFYRFVQGCVLRISESNNR